MAPIDDAPLARAAAPATFAVAFLSRSIAPALGTRPLRDSLVPLALCPAGLGCLRLMPSLPPA